MHNNNSDAILLYQPSGSITLDFHLPVYEIADYSDSAV
jgi:hypothetical protein